MSASVEICELLCYVQNKYASSTKTGLITAVSGFYSVDEITAAKSLLYDIFDKLRAAGAVPSKLKHRCINRKQVDEMQKRRVDTEDILALFGDLDINKVPLPVFVSANLQRVPPFSPDATDFCSMAFNVNKLQSQMAVLEQRLSTLTSTQHAAPAVLPDYNVPKGPALPVVIDDQPPMGASETAAPSWASTAAQESEKWKLVEARAKQRKSQVTVQGKKATSESDSAVKGVPRKAVLHAFVGRLRLETTEEDLTKYLTDVGVKGVMCKKLKAKNGKQFTTAAFHVSCCAESKVLFFDENCWPEGAELRDWIFYN